MLEALAISQKNKVRTPEVHQKTRGIKIDGTIVSKRRWGKTHFYDLYREVCKIVQLDNGHHAINSCFLTYWNLSHSVSFNYETLTISGNCEEIKKICVMYVTSELLFTS